MLVRKALAADCDASLAEYRGDAGLGSAVVGADLLSCRRRRVAEVIQRQDARRRARMAAWREHVKTAQGPGGPVANAWLVRLHAPPESISTPADVSLSFSVPLPMSKRSEKS